MRFKDRTIGILVAPGFDDYQVLQLVVAMKERGAGVLVIGVGDGARKTAVSGSGSIVSADATLDKITADAIDALVIPSRSSQKELIENAGVMTLVFGVVSGEKPIGTLGNGVMVLAAAGLLEGRRVAAPGIDEEKLREDGVNILDQELVVDRNIVTARSVEALEHFVDVIAFLLEPAPSYS